MSDDEITLKEHFESRVESIIKDLEALEKLIDMRLKSVTQSIDLASKVMDSRLEHMNGAFQIIKLQANEAFTKLAHEEYAKALASDIRDLRESRAELKGKASQSSVNLAYFIAVIGMLISFTTMIFTFAHK